MAGYKGLGVSKKEIAQESGSSLAIYELAAGDIYDGYAFDMREELLNHMILVKSTVTNNMLSVFIPKTMGEDDDVIRFKLIDDLHDAGGDTPYIDFWGEDWAEDINVKDLQINNVDESDGFYWIMESQNEAFFKKVNGEWKVIRDKGVFDLNEFKNPRFGELNVRNLIADNYLSINVKDTHVANFNWDKLMLDTLVQFKGHLYSIYQDFQPEKTDLGLIDRPFGDLFLKGNAISAEPTADNHLATKKYVDENSGSGIRRTSVEMDIVIPAGLPLDTDLGFYDIDTLIASQLTGDLLNTAEDNRLRLVQNCGLFQAQAKIVNIHLLAVYKDNGNSQFIDFDGYAKQDDTNTFKRILKYSGRSTENNILHSHSVFDVGYTSDVLGQGSELYLVIQRKFNNTNEIKARVHISIDYQL